MIHLVEPGNLADIPADALASEFAAIEAEFSRRQQMADPVLWVERKLKEKFWSKQREIARALATHRRVAVPSCHEVGKSYSAANLACWWIDRSKPGDAFVVTSAPTNPQVRAILWRELGRVHTRGNLAGRVNQVEWMMPVKGGKEELVAIGRKPDDYDGTAFQGIHAPRVLVIFDEACGIPGALWEAADSLIANDNSKIIVFGNPDDPETEFANICKPGSGWHVVSISAFDSPNFTGEEMPQFVLDQLIGRTYVEEKRKKWAPTWTWTEDGSRVVPPPGADEFETHPFWQSKVLGRFPVKADSGTLIPAPWIRRAQEATLDDTGTNRLGVDVGAGGDESVICHKKGYRYRIVFESKNPDTMQTCGEVIALRKSLAATAVHIDKIGIGKGMTDRGKELNEPFIGINVGEGAVELKETDPAFGDEREPFVNLRAQFWWNVRTLFERGEVDIDPLDEDLAAELTSIRFSRTSSGKIQIESKKDALKRKVPSPNKADALMLAANDAPPEGMTGGLLW